MIFAFKTTEGHLLRGILQTFTLPLSRNLEYVKPSGTTVDWRLSLIAQLPFGLTPFSENRYYGESVIYRDRLGQTLCKARFVTWLVYWSHSHTPKLSQ